jgi:hypothetical protein
MILQIYWLINEVALPIGLRALLDWALVVPCDLSCSSPVALALLLSDIKGHAQSLLVLSLVRLQKGS